MKEIKELPEKIFLNNPPEETLIFRAEKPHNHQVNILITDSHKLDLTIHLNNPEGLTNIEILYLGEKDETSKIKIAIIHEIPESKSRVRIKSILPEGNLIILEGLIRIERKANLSEAELRAEALLIGPNSKAEFVPSLEILANKVLVSHSAAVSSFDEEKMFYLKTRGLTEQTAKIALIESFIAPVIPEENKEEINKAVINFFK